MAPRPKAPTSKNRGMATCLTWRASFQRPRELLSDTSWATARGKPAVAKVNTGP